MSQLRHLQHVRSNQIEQTGLPKFPVATDLFYGELAVNYAAGGETITLRNSSNQLAVFRPNTNVYAVNLTEAVSFDSLKNVVNIPSVYSYQDFNITYLKKYMGDFDLTDFLGYIMHTFYDVSNLHIVLNIAKGDDSDGNPTSIIVHGERMAALMNNIEKPLHKDSSIIGFTKYDMDFVAGDSTAMCGIEIIWDKTTKAMMVRYVYLDNAHRLDGQLI